MKSGNGGNLLAGCGLLIWLPVLLLGIGLVFDGNVAKPSVEQIRYYVLVPALVAILLSLAIYIFNSVRPSQIALGWVSLLFIAFFSVYIMAYTGGV